MKQLNQNDLMAIAGGVYPIFLTGTGGPGREFYTEGLSTACQNAFHVDSYISRFFNPTEFQTALAQCTENDTSEILNQLGTPLPY